MTKSVPIANKVGRAPPGKSSSGVVPQRVLDEPQELWQLIFCWHISDMFCQLNMYMNMNASICPSARAQVTMCT